MAGTLLLLRRSGYETHYLNLASGSCGSTQFNAARTRSIRRGEAQAAARILGAHYHAPLVDDLEIFYEIRILRRLAAIVREIRPAILLTHSPQDYMEDHTNTCRLAVTAAFARGMPNFRTAPARPAIDQEVAVYHAMPHGLRDSLGRRILPGAFVNTTSVHAVKREALAAHQSQKSWLDSSQGLDSYLHTVDEMSRAVGKMSRRFQHAEGWRRHLHLGFCAADADPLRAALKRNYLANKLYERRLDQGAWP
ncbi:MAG: PIG-L family deacetylase [Chloroflexi bacterium]|nr:PIG-L family deacetylase [Chloroflexota bacterium]